MSVKAAVSAIAEFKDAREFGYGTSGDSQLLRLSPRVNERFGSAIRCRPRAIGARRIRNLWRLSILPDFGCCSSPSAAALCSPRTAFSRTAFSHFHTNTSQALVGAACSHVPAPFHRNQRLRLY